MSETDSKRDQILEKAELRFSHFGIEKTTMNEIAEDLSMSKPSVYYYFPDKLHLVSAVVEKILGEYQSQLRDLFERSDSLKGAIFSMLELRSEFAKKYFMLHLSDHTDMTAAKHAMRPTIQRVFVKEIGLIRKIFERASVDKEIKVDSLQNTAELFLDVIGGVNYCVFARQEKSLVPEAAAFKEVVERQKEVTEIFIRGISI